MLTLDDAQKIIAAAHVRAAHLNVRVSVAVVDAGAHLLALGRMDGANPISPQIAEAKAVSAAMFQRDGGSLLQTATERPAFFNAVSGLARTKLVPGHGSVLLQKDGAVLGAVGVSGAKPEQDLECAEAGAETFG
ncbi:MAG TPA: heme-binding protein [Candidatus Dormibacteraeota bacterium]|nr:heme-binding protein [Candidatus Dormibacteraeota bacterium]